ncbi:phage tail family protein [Bacillus cereus]|nr:phage tail family protein [Bacillus cereus]
MSFIFRGKHASRFMLVNHIERNFLPTKQANLLKASGKIGAYDFGSETDVSRYNVMATITAASDLEREEKLDEARKWLNEEGELIFDFKNHVSYTAKLDGDSHVNPIGTSCTISFTLLCSDPIGDGLEKTYEIKQGEMKAELVNEGTAEAYPNVKVKFTEDTPVFNVIGRDYAVTVGNSPDYHKEDIPYEERVLYDELIDPRKWTDANDIYDGIVYGTFESNGYLFHQKDWDYGKPPAGGTDPKFNGWHGASMYRNLPEPIENFMVELHCTFRSWDRLDMGRVGFYLLDPNGRKFGNAHLNDVTWMKTQQIASVKFGDNSSGTAMVYDRGAFDGVWSGWDDGIIRFGRKKRKGYVTWFTYYAIRDSKTGRFHTELYREYADYSGMWLQKLAGVQIETSALGNGDKHYYMTLNHVNVFKYNEDKIGQTNDIPFKVGDELEIDMASAAVYKNGILANDLLDPSSDFFSIPTGRSEIAVFPTTAGDTEVKFTNKYL